MFLRALLMRLKVKRHLRFSCHSGLSGIFLCFQKDSRRASLAGMTTCVVLLMNSLVYMACVIFMLPAALCSTRAACAEDRKPTEYDVKAAYIYNFAKFVEWSKGKSPEPLGTITVCVVGSDPFGPTLAAIEGKTVEGKKIRTRRDPAVQNVKGCEVLFISGSEEERLDRVLEAVKGLTVLTIGDTKGFAQRGVMINFYMENRNVRFEINPKAAERAGLKISSNLLKIAKIVGEP